MPNALIGYTGFVGSTLLRQMPFESQFRSTNISEIEGNSYNLVICAGAPAQKWIANREPEADRKKIEGLISHLRTIQCGTFVLISTIDVFAIPIEVNENTPIVESGLHPYGLHRRLLEKFVTSHFPKHLVIRLPGLVGPGLRKNVIFDLLNSNNLHAIDSRGVFQFYPMVNLSHDIQTALHAELKLVHLTAAPISVSEVAAEGFGMPFNHSLQNATATYDMRSVHSKIFGGGETYQYSKREIIQAIRSYAQSEPITIKVTQGAGK